MLDSELPQRAYPHDHWYYRHICYTYTDFFNKSKFSDIPFKASYCKV